MPEPEPGERFPRAKFLEASTLGLGAVIGGLVTVPVLGFMVIPAFEDQGYPKVDLGPIENFPEGQWLVTTFFMRPDQGDVSRRTAYVRNNGSLNGSPSFTIISNRCVHLGCPVQPNGPTQADQKKEVRGSSKQQITLVPDDSGGRLRLPLSRRPVRLGGQSDVRPARAGARPLRVRHRRGPPDPR